MKKYSTIIKVSIAFVVALLIGIWIGSTFFEQDHKVEATQLTKDSKTEKDAAAEEEEIEPSPPDSTETTETVGNVEGTEEALEVVSISEETPTNTESSNEQVTDTKKTLTRDLVREKATLFDAPIYWAATNNDVLVDYHSIEQLVTQFYAGFANTDLAYDFVYAFFYEEGNQVRLKPGQLQTIFEPDKDFVLIPVNENEYTVKQARSGIDGSTTYLVLSFKYDEKINDWKIDSILYE